MTRSDLHTCINDALSAAGFTPAQAAPVRAVAETTTLVTIGLMDVNGCGCPLVQAGILDTHGSPTSKARALGLRPRHLDSFVRIFDTTALGVFLGDRAETFMGNEPIINERTP